MADSFISISAVSDADQLRRIAAIYQQESVSDSLVIGYQVSSKSINQGTQNSRQPKFSELPALDALTVELGLVPAIHYYTKDQSTILADLEQIADCGVVPGLLQFNTLPPSRDVLAQTKDMGYKPLFKVAVSDKSTADGGYAVWKGEGVHDVSSGNIEPLLDQAKSRSDLIEYVMFDPSHGTNLSLSLDPSSLAIRFGQAVVEDPAFDHAQLVYAGGINPDNVGAVTASLHAHVPGRFCIDAESGLRTDDVLDMDKVRGYLRNFEAALSSD